MRERWVCPTCGRGTRLNVCMACERPALVERTRASLPRRQNLCKRCGGELTSRESRLRGYGPDCWQAVQLDVMARRLRDQPMSPGVRAAVAHVTGSTYRPR